MFSRMVIFGLLTLSMTAQAATPLMMKEAKNANPQVIKQSLKNAFPRIHKIGNIESSPIPGIVSVEVDGASRVYLTRDGKYMFFGKLYQLKGPDGVVDLTEQHLAKVRKASFKKVKSADMVTFKADGNQKAQVYVFTDVTCPFCRRFHQGIDKINQMGITVHYLAFPRTGLDNKVAREMSHVWCARKPRKALTEAKLGKSVADLPERKDCASPVAAEYGLGLKLGVQGTPSIFTVDGKELGGYLSPAQLAAKLGLKKAG